MRPPQPAAYVFVLDVSRIAVESGYIKVFCDCLLSQLEALPGDSRTSVAFVTYDSTVHYYSLADTQAQPHQMVVVDIDGEYLSPVFHLLSSILLHFREQKVFRMDLISSLLYSYTYYYFQICSSPVLIIC